MDSDKAKNLYCYTIFQFVLYCIMISMTSASKPIRKNKYCTGAV